MSDKSLLLLINYNSYVTPFFKVADLGSRSLLNLRFSKVVTIHALNLIVVEYTCLPVTMATRVW